MGFQGDSGAFFPALCQVGSEVRKPQGGAPCFWAVGEDNAMTSLHPEVCR